MCLIKYEQPKKKSFHEVFCYCFYSFLSIERRICSSGNEGVGLFPMNPISRKMFPNLKKGKNCCKGKSSSGNEGVGLPAPYLFLLCEKM